MSTASDNGREITLELPDEAAMTALGGTLAEGLREGGVVYLQGDLGVGKSTLSRGILRALGVQGPIKSPTYTLVEPYDLGGQMAYHLDLYRLADPEELEFLGIRDELEPGDILLVEWPARGGGRLPAADLWIDLAYQGSGRRATLRPAAGHEAWLAALPLPAGV